MNNGLSAKIAFIFGNFLMIGLFVFGVYELVTIKSVIDGLFAAYMVIICGVLAGILFFVLYVRHWVENGCDWLFLLNRKYKKVRPALSPIAGKIKQQDYASAITELENILQEFPDYCLASYMLFRVYADDYCDFDNAYEVGKSYFSLDKRREDEHAMEYLFRYSDMLFTLNLFDENLSFLTEESKRKFYSNREKKLIESRLANLKR